MGKITFQTGGGNLIDIVDSISDVKSPYYILKKDLEPMWNFLQENKVDKVTNEISKILMEKGFLKKDVVPF